jgi:hypothetical protein
MAIEPPVHVPEDPAQRRRDRGHALVLVGYLMLVSDLILGAFVFSARRGEGGKMFLLVMILDAVVAAVLLVVGNNMKKSVAGR